MGLRVAGEGILINRDASESKERDGSQRGLIHSRKHAIIAVVITLVVLVSAFRSAVTRTPQNRWLFEPIPILTCSESSMYRRQHLFLVLWHMDSFLVVQSRP